MTQDTFEWSDSTAPGAGPHAFIQWKGTDVCMDCRCLCGQSFHVDGYFAYAVRCEHRGREYELSVYVAMREGHDQLKVLTTTGDLAEPSDA